ncbi:hypothetical protein [Aeromonas caviae]|uniref:hypothetical protein n=1 Tax=Aeromonas caviae TaxID=648 RepID=UPI002B4A851B|nr:hypothetical protein [Aeromonas caviae]
MIIEEAIANNMGGVITGSVAILTSCIAAGVAVWVSSINHDRALEKEKKAVLMAKLEDTLKETIRWRNAISLYMLYIKDDVIKSRDHLSDMNKLYGNHQISLNDTSVDSLTLYAKLSINDEVISSCEDLYKKHLALMDFIIKYSKDSSVEELESIGMAIQVSIVRLIEKIEKELRILLM